MRRGGNPADPSESKDLKRDDSLLEKSLTRFKGFVLSNNQLLILLAHHFPQDTLYC